MAPEFFPKIQRHRKNDPAWRYLLTPFPLESEPKSYGVDGPITAYVGEEGAWLYATLRRGGRAAYAFDVADIASEDPSPPTLKWKIGCPNADDDVGCTAGFEGLGQTWSSAKVIKSAGYPADLDDERAPLVIMGGGYDTCEDTDDGTVNHTCVAASNGRHVYVLDADIKVPPLKTFNTERSVVADIFVVTYKCPDSDAAPADPDNPDDPAACPNIDGKAKWGYVADLGGNLYRISGATANTPIGTTAPADWTMTKIASLGCDDTDLNPDPAVNPCLANRKFIFAPDVVAKSNVVPEEKIYYLLVGSGDREKPLKEFEATYGVKNYFFMVQDKPRDPEWLSEELDDCGASVICKDSLLEIGVADLPDPGELALTKGWALELRDHEQIVTSAITVFGTTTFSSHTPYVPVPGSCESDLGTARVYNISFMNAKSRNGTVNRFEEVSGGGLPPSPVAGLVWLDGMDPEKDKPMPFIIGADPTSPLEGRRPTEPSTTNQPKSLTYWFIEK
jgi:type IV pilus assembly protein PilY1